MNTFSKNGYVVVNIISGSFANLFVYKWTHLFYPFFPGKTDKIAKSMFDEAATDVENELVQTSNSGMTYFAEQKFGRLEHKMDHLACFGGMYI